MGSDLLTGLPLEPLVREGLEDLAAGHARTLPARLLRIAAPRLQAAGLPVQLPGDDETPEIALYAELRARHGTEAFSRYKALLGELSSFLNALDARHERAATTPPPAP